MKVSPGYAVAVLENAPSENLVEFSPIHENLEKVRIFIQDSETFIVHYTGTAKTTQGQVAGYTMGPGDTLYLKIDRTSDTVTVYHP